MQKIYRKLGDFKPLIFTIDLSNYEKTADDIVDIFCSIKNVATEDDDVLFFKKNSLGQIMYSGKTKLLINVEWNYNEYTNLPIGNYKLGLFLKFIGDPSADENVNQTFEVSVVQDFLKDN